MSLRFLLDTSVVSIFTPGRAVSNPEVVRWMASNTPRLHMSVVTIFEVEQGAAKLDRAGGSARAALYRNWIREVGEQLGSRVLAVDAEVARLAGNASDAAWARGNHPGLADILIAATAKAHDLVLLTRNVKHFTPLGIDVVDPLISLPD